MTGRDRIDSPTVGLQCELSDDRREASGEMVGNRELSDDRREASGEMIGNRAPTVIPVELAGWVTRFVGGSGAGRRVFEEPLAEPGTVRSVLRGLSDRFPELAAALWHGTELGEHIEVLVNDAVLDIDHTIDSRLRPGDGITLIGQYLGG